MSKKNNLRIAARYSDEWAEILVRDDLITEVHLKPGSYDRSHVERIINRIKELKKSNQLLVLILAHKKSSVTLDGIRGLFSRDSLTYSVAKAYVIYKPFHFFLAKACMFIYEPSTPIRFFNNRDEAEAWLTRLIGYGL